MNMYNSFFSLGLLVISCALAAMDPAQEIGAFVRDARPEGINIGQANVGIRDTLVEHRHVQGEQQTRVLYYVQGNQEYDQNQSLKQQMRNTLLSGVKQTVFDLGHTPGKFIGYATQIAATVGIEFTIILLKKAWGHLTSNNKQRAEEEAQQALAKLAAEEALIQSQATHLKNIKIIADQTDAERETYKTLLSQYIANFKQFSQHTTEYMAQHTNKSPAPNTAL